MSRFACAGTVVLFAAILASPLEAQDRPRPVKQPRGKAIAIGALGGAAIGALPGASWGHQMADGANALTGAGVLAGVGAASGAAIGAANAVLPPRRGWKKYAQATAIGMAVSGLSFWAIGELNGNVGPWHPDDFRNVGLGHGVITGAVIVKFGR
jgi:hypothetical protein